MKKELDKDSTTITSTTKTPTKKESKTILSEGTDSSTYKTVNKDAFNLNDLIKLNRKIDFDLLEMYDTNKNKNNLKNQKEIIC